MKTLYLVRHAKSAWDLAFVPDRERPLAERGRREAKKMAKRLAKRGVRPDVIVTSPAARALLTARTMAKKLGVKAKSIKVDHRLYADGQVDLVDAIQSMDKTVKTVMLVGHNPSLADLAHHFTPGIHRMPTCSVAEFRFDADRWARVNELQPVHFVFEAPHHH